METVDLERRIRDYVIPDIRKKYHITGQYLSLEAAAEVIQIVRLGLRVTGGGGSLPRRNSSNSGLYWRTRYTSNSDPGQAGNKTSYQQ